MGRRPIYRGKKTVERAKGQPTLCRWCPKVPEGVEPKRANAVDLSPRNRQALWHYMTCRAVGRYPADPWAERNGAVIRGVMDAADDGGGTGGKPKPPGKWRT